RAVVPASEILAEAVAVQPTHSGLASEHAVHETHFTAVGKQIHDLVVQTLVQIVAIRMLQPADRVHILQRSDFSGQLLQLPAQRLDLIAHGALLEALILGAAYTSPPPRI